MVPRDIRFVEAEEEISRLVSELEYYTQQVDSIGGVLVDLTRSKKKHQGLISEASDTYQLLTLDVVEIYNAIKRVYRNAGQRLGADQKPIPIELLENTFVILREAAEKAESRANKLSRSRTREAKMVRSAANALASLAENAAKVLVSEANKIDRWTPEWERELGIRRWLR